MLGLVLSGAVATSCLVSFNDYPVGDIRPDPSAGAPSMAGNGGSGGTPGGNGGGGAGTGAAAATGGAAGGGATAAVVDLIDDFEDGNSQILPSEGRSGFWQTTNDGAGVQTPSSDAALSATLEPARGDSSRALHTTGSGFDRWGAAVRTDFNQQGFESQAYDVSGYTGLKLWARTGNGDTDTVRVQIVTPGTEDGCFTCADHFGSDAQLTAEWQEFTLPFAEMEQQGWGMPQLSSFDLENALGLQFTFARNDDFDVWIDDVGFY